MSQQIIEEQKNFLLKHAPPITGKKRKIFAKFIFEEKEINDIFNEVKARAELLATGFYLEYEVMGRKNEKSIVRNNIVLAKGRSIEGYNHRDSEEDNFVFTKEEFVQQAYESTIVCLSYTMGFTPKYPCYVRLTTYQDKNDNHLKAQNDNFVEEQRKRA